MHSNNNTLSYLSYNKTLFFKNAYELKLRLLYCLLSLSITIIACYIYSDAIIYFFVNPILIKMSSQRFIFTSLKEIFFMYLKFSCISGLFFTLPIFFTQFILFFLNGLYKYEVKLILYISLFSFCLFCLGFCLGYKVIIPNAWNFFLSFENQNAFFPLHFEAKLNNYLFFIINVLLGIILCFQIPSIIFLLVSFNFILNIEFFKKRKLIYIINVILGTLISSPDIFSQLFIICSLIFIYEILIFFLFFIKELKKD